MECRNIGVLGAKATGIGPCGGRNYAGKVADFYAFFREVSRKFAQIRAVVTRFYAFLRVRLFFGGWRFLTGVSDAARIWRAPGLIGVCIP